MKLSILVASTLLLTTQAVQAADSQVLTAGQYLVTAGRDQACVASDLNLKKEYKFNTRTGELPEAIISVAGIVSDNLMHPNLCFLRPPQSKGTVVITIEQPTKVETTGDLSIIEVRAITSKEDVPVLDPSQAYPTGPYVMALEGPGKCRDAEVNVAERRVYHTKDGAQTLTVELENSGRVEDDLIRPAICKLSVKDTATVYVDLSAKQGAVKGIGEDALHVVRVEKVTASEPVALQ